MGLFLSLLHFSNYIILYLCLCPRYDSNVTKNEWKKDQCNMMKDLQHSSVDTIMENYQREFTVEKMGFCCCKGKAGYYLWLFFKWVA